MGSGNEQKRGFDDIIELGFVGRFAIRIALRLHDGNLLDLFELGLVHARRCRMGLIERVIDLGRVLEHAFEFGPFIRLFAIARRNTYRSCLEFCF